MYAWLRYSIGGALIVAAAGGWALSALRISTTQAIISAPVSQALSSAEGRVLWVADSGRGIEVRQGQALARIKADLPDRSHLIEIEAHLERLTAEAALAARREADLSDLLADLNRRAEAHREAALMRLSARSEADKAHLEACEARLGDALQQLERLEAIRRSGSVSQSQLDAAQAIADAARAERDEAAALLAMTGTDLDALRRGVWSAIPEGAPWPERQAMEVARDLAAASRDIARTTAEREAVARQVDKERALLAARADFEVVAPGDGVLFRRAAADRVAPGDLLLEVVDCDAREIAASFPANALSRLSPDDIVEIRVDAQGWQKLPNWRLLGGAARLEAADYAAAPRQVDAADSILLAPAGSVLRDAPMCGVGRIVALRVTRVGGPARLLDNGVIRGLIDLGSAVTAEDASSAAPIDTRTVAVTADRSATRHRQ